MKTAASFIEHFPRAAIMQGPTPLEHAPRLSDALGVDLWIKRDDLGGPSYGGNKSRQLEFYLGEAQAQNADTVLITGAVQSNFVRLAAAASARLGMKCIVQLEDRVPNGSADYATSGNVLLAELLGAEMMRYPEGEDEAGADRALRQRAEALRAEGRRPFVIPLGPGNRPLGAMGYMLAADEMRAQQPAGFDAVVTASGSALTHGGLLAGYRVAGDATRLIGSCVRRPRFLQIDRVAAVTQAIEDMIQTPLHITEGDIEIWDGALAPGYGRIGSPAIQAMQLAARTEGLILDPVYTAKAFAAIPALIASGDIHKGARVGFVHTGGLAALFAYADEIRAAMKAGDTQSA